MLVAGLGQPGFESAMVEYFHRHYGSHGLSVFAVDSGKSKLLFQHGPQTRDALSSSRKVMKIDDMQRDRFVRENLDTDIAFAVHLSQPSSSADHAGSMSFRRCGTILDSAEVMSTKGEMALYARIYFKTGVDSPTAESMELLRSEGPLIFEIIRKHYLLRSTKWTSRIGKRVAEQYVSGHLIQLSRRETQVCARIICGYSTDAIGSEISITNATVKTFRRRAYAKLGISSQNELFARCAALNY